MQPIAIAASLSLLATAAAQSWLALDGPVLQTSGGAYDLARNRAVVLDQLGETWELEGDRWQHRAVFGSSPSARSGTSLCYDDVHGRVLLFGGATAAGPLGDTWTWDGGTWTQLPGANAPAPRSGAPFAWDLARGRAVLFGGFGYNDTWEHDGVQWIQRGPATVPTDSPLAMTFDATRLETLLLTSTGVPGQFLRLWRWNGVDWTLAVAPGNAPTSRTNAGFAYDYFRRRSILLGGRVAGLVATSDLWEWNGTAWLPGLVFSAPLFEPPAAWFDFVRGKVVVVSGRDVARGGYQRDVWSWDGTTLLQELPNQQPVERLVPLWVHDPVRRRTLLFGGDTRGPANDTWTWSGTRWTQHVPAIAPAPRSQASGTFDLARGRVVLFGGVTATGIVGDTWLWSGSAWTQFATSGPPARRSAAMAFDVGAGMAVLFGGQLANGQYGNDTWLWNGAGWTQAQPALSPSPRAGPAMAHDPTRQRTVLFGGARPLIGGQLADTWEWNGSGWQQQAPLASPLAYPSPSAVFDASRARVVLIGATVVAGGLGCDTWAYDGTTWTLLGSQAVAGQQAAPVVAFDSERQRLLDYDGQTVREWSATAATVSDLGSGCGNAPRLLPRARTRLGDGDCGVECFGAAGHPALFCFSLTTGSTPLGNGCTLRVGAGAVTTFTLARSDGRFAADFAIPLAPALRGLSLVAQALLPDPTQPGGFALTNAIQLVVGD